MPDSADIERCKFVNGDLMCVLIKGHEGAHCLRDVPVFNNEPLMDAFCPYCGSRPALEGPGCEECGGEA